MFDFNERKNFENIEEFKKYIKQKLKDKKFGISQIYRNNICDYGNNDIEEENEMLHSFYVGISEKNNIVNFEKEGYNSGMFRITRVEKVFNKYNVNNINTNEYQKWSKKTYFGVMSYSEFEEKIKNGFQPID